MPGSLRAADRRGENVPAGRRPKRAGKPDGSKAGKPAGRTPLPAALGFRSLVPGLIRAGWDLLKKGSWRLLAVYAVSQALPLLLVSPLIHWMFTQALSSTGVHAVNSAWISEMLANRVSLAWVVGLSVLALLTVSLQLSFLVLAASQVRAGGSLRPAALIVRLRPVVRRLARPGFLPLGAYLFLAVPLTQAGFFSVLTHAVSIPNFVSGEMLKSTQGTLVYVVFLVVVGTVALRCSLAVPLFAVCGVPGGKAMRLSWRVTGQTTPALLVAGAAAAATGLFAGACLVVLALLPTLGADLLLPGAAAGVAAFSLGAAQVAGVVIAGGFVLFVAGMLLELTERSMPLLPPEVQPRWNADATQPAGSGGAAGTPASGGLGDEGSVGTDAAPATGTAVEAAVRPGVGAVRTWVEPKPAVARVDGSGEGSSRLEDSLRGSRRKLNRTRAAVAGAVVVPALILGVLNLPVMDGLREVPQSLVLGHRGFSGGGVENTISGLRAASEAGADLVEMDVMQTSDGEFVVMHDASLQRLAGRNAAVADLTLAELTSLTVHDQFGHTDSIPSLREYILAAQEASEPLLIELKLHGGETDDYVERLVAELEGLDALHENIYHSLSQEKAEELKRLRPELYVGLTLAVAGVAAPETTADFIVVEEASYTDAVRESAWANGKDVYVWTVNGSDAIRNMLRDNVDGIITDHPDLALQDRQAMGPDELMSSKLYDALMRFVVIF
ncbi:glycerophosphodiester phosphodiesterase family protein [Arthrobacter sp. NPDC055585]